MVHVSCCCSVGERMEEGWKERTTRPVEPTSAVVVIVAFALLVVLLMIGSGELSWNEEGVGR